MLFISRRQLNCAQHSRMSPSLSFNLGIEMLFISSFVNRRTRSKLLISIVSISESRCFSFQVITGRFVRYDDRHQRFNLGIEMLFISRYRCFRFSTTQPLITMFQSRNRDAFHFKKRNRSNSATAISNNAVSISESRCFSFQDHKMRSYDARALTVLVSISESRCFSFQDFVLRTRIRITTDSDLFQSRNRDAFRFKCKHLHSIVANKTRS